MSEKQTRRQAVETLEKTFDPAHFEERWYSTWEKEGRFQPRGPAGSPRFVMVIPPPNVTGRLHIGHAYGRTIEDILARWQTDVRATGSCGSRAPTTPASRPRWWSSASSRSEGIRRRDLGREEFIERVWAWKRESGDAILAQLRRLGCSLDWTPRCASRWTPTSRGRSAGLRAALSRRARSTRAATSSTGARAAGPRCRTSRWCTGRRRERCTTIRYDVAGSRGRSGRRDDAARDDARRHRAGDPSRRPAHRGAAREDGDPADHEPRDPDRRGPDPRRPGVRDRRREGDAGPRRQRLRVGAAA